MIPVKQDPLKPAVLTYKMSLDTGTGFTSSMIKKHIKVFLMDLAYELKHKGCTLIGHIKGMVETTESRKNLFFSLTDFFQDPTFKGSVIKGGEEAYLIINVIVYGIAKPEVEMVLEKCLARNKISKAKK